MAELPKSSINWSTIGKHREAGSQGCQLLLKGAKPASKGNMAERNQRYQIELLKKVAASKYNTLKNNNDSVTKRFQKLMDNAYLTEEIGQNNQRQSNQSYQNYQ